MSESADILHKLNNLFVWMESKNLKVGLIFLNEVEVAQLRDLSDFDLKRQTKQEYDEDFEPGRLVGYLWGADVRAASNLVPDNHAMVLPDGVTVRDFGKESCTPLS